MDDTCTYTVDSWICVSDPDHQNAHYAGTESKCQKCGASRMSGLDCTDMSRIILHIGALQDLITAKAMQISRLQETVKFKETLLNESKTKTKKRVIDGAFFYN